MPALIQPASPASLARVGNVRAQQVQRRVEAARNGYAPFNSKRDVARACERVLASKGAGMLEFQERLSISDPALWPDGLEDTRS